MENMEIAEYIIQQIRDGIDDWEMPWHKGIREAINPATQKLYHGQNAVILWVTGQQRGFESVEWATLKQWSSLKGRLRRGCKGVRIVRPRLHTQADIFGGTTSNPQGFNYYTVFNYEDVNGINRDHPDLFENPHTDSVKINTLAERVVTASEARIKYQSDRAYYKPSEDSIYMPKRSAFKASRHASISENFYATLLHELIHWTEKENRCNRTPFLDDIEHAYAFEELVAELGSAILNTRFHQLPEPRKDHAAYIHSWLRLLENDTSLFYRAMGLAQASTDWLCSKANIHIHNYEWLPESNSPIEQAPEAGDSEWATPAPQEAVKVRTAVKAFKVDIDTNTTGQFRSYFGVEVICGDCAQAFKVTLHRCDCGCTCPGCNTYNLINDE